ncbi:hypothetical protein [Streptacidiphilus cavernicola]|uniref:Uncharacterized protein n=1 Tax=Streptacidiphilus cavernicola TaxID=3342716 RepID=A0ABV6VUX0_9ACTN
MRWDLLAFALVGLAVGAAAALLLPRLFTVHRGMVVLTGLCAALLTGSLGYAVVGSGHLYLTVPGCAVGACAMVSLLAHPENRRSPSTRYPHHA